jgi:competence protein ComEC
MLEITIWDVQHGSAAHIKTPNGRHIAVDLGDDDNFSPLRTLYGRGVRQLDAVVITHPHRDHMDDISNFDLLSPRTLWRPRHLSDDDIRIGNRTEDSGVVDRYLEINQRYTELLTAATDITNPESLGGATIRVFVPRNCSAGNLNNHSVVVVASFANLKIVIPGDNEPPSWNELLSDPNFVQAIRSTDVFVASHHGRINGYSAELFQVMGKPKLVVVSDGRFCETSATDRYSKQATGWTVYGPLGQSQIKKCVTTRSDGHITIKVGWNEGSRNFLNVTRSKPEISALAEMLMGLSSSK